MQVDYILCRRCRFKEVRDCKGVAGESLVRQHRMVVRMMNLDIQRKKTRTKAN